MFLALVCISRMEHFEKQALVDYNFKILKEVGLFIMLSQPLFLFRT